MTHLRIAKLPGLCLFRATLVGLLLLPIHARAAEPVIRSEDTVTLQVAGEPDLSRSYVVDSAGEIVLALAGKCRIGGLSPVQAERSLTTVLGKYLKVCEVRLTLAPAPSAPVSLVGEVLRPGPIKSREGLTLLAALAEAGGGSPRAELRKIKVFRASGEVLQADLTAALLHPGADVPLVAGDRVLVPRSEADIWVEGQVKSPGERRLEEAPTAYTAVRRADPADTADLSRVMIRRLRTPALLTVDLTPVEAGNPAADVPLEAGDRLLVPTRVRGQVSLRGEVKSPGVHPLAGKLRLLDYINQQGGGFSERADRGQVELRRGGITRLLNLEELGEGKPDGDPELEPGDVVQVRDDSALRVVVLGAVRKPGAFRVKPGATLVDVLAEADGTTDRADLGGIVLLRADAPPPAKAPELVKRGRKEQRTPDLGGALVLDLRKLRKGDAAQNPVIQAGDRVVVQERPTDGGRKGSLLEGVLRFLPLFSLFGGGLGGR